MIRTVILICIVASTSSAPVMEYTINVDGPEGRHVQMGEPGKSVSGYYTSRSLDGLMEYKTMYEADEKGYRATGDHLPVASVAAVRSLETAPGYVFKYDAPGSHSHYMMGEPGKAVQGSFTYTDSEGRSRRVDYEADENGYRVKPTEEEKPIEINIENDAEVVKSSDVIAAVPIPETAPIAEAAPIAEIAAEPIPEIPIAPASEIVAEPIPEIAIDPVAKIVIESNPEVASARVDEAVVPEPVAEPAPEPVAEPASEPVAEPVPVQPSVEAVAVAEAKPESRAVYAVPISFPSPTYYSLPARLVQPALPAFHYAAPYAYGYSVGYPLTGGNYVYSL